MKTLRQRYISIAEEEIQKILLPASDGLYHPLESTNNSDLPSGFRAQTTHRCILGDKKTT